MSRCTHSARDPADGRRCRMHSAGSGRARAWRLKGRRNVLTSCRAQMIPGLEQKQSRPTDFTDGASCMSPALERVRDEPGSFVLLLFFQSAFLLRSMPGLFPLLPFPFVFSSFVTHIHFFFLKNNLHQNVAQTPASENEVQGIVAARAAASMLPDPPSRPSSSARRSRRSSSCFNVKPSARNCRIKPTASCSWGSASDSPSAATRYPNGANRLARLPLARRRARASVVRSAIVSRSHYRGRRGGIMKAEEPSWSITLRARPGPPGYCGRPSVYRWSLLKKGTCSSPGYPNHWYTCETNFRVTWSGRSGTLMRMGGARRVSPKYY